jgi:predicted nucleic acid-binding protein
VTGEQAKPLPLASFDLLAARSRPLRHGPADFESAEKVVRGSTRKLAAPDALHLASAKNARVALVTFDARVADAAYALAVEVAGLV